MTDRDELLDLIVRWEEAEARGEAVSPEDLCGGCPGRLDELRRALGKLGEVAWLNEPIAETRTWPSADAPPPPPEPGLPRLMADRYRLDVLVGQGGFGRVFRGFDTWLERPVAVKVPRVDRPVSAPEIDLCRLEARKVARLRHPNVVPVHDVGRDGDTCFIVSDWIEGRNLADRIAAGPIPPREAARLVAQVADALHHAHQAGFVHRDIKPANILIDAQGEAYLTDFGVAVLEEELLRDVGAAGTLPYMAPEQLDPDLGPVDQRADLYALGVVLFEALTGRRPFRAATPVGLREAILRGGPAPPRSIDARIPEALERIYLAALARRPEERYRDAAALAADLRAALPRDEEHPA